MEWARTNRHHGFITSWPQFGGPAGLLLANLAVFVFSAISGDQFLVWGWRIPFMLSIVMVAVGLYIRLGILETPVFRRLVAEERIERVPVLEVIKRQPRQIILSAFARMAEQAPAYIYLAFVFTYGTQVLHTSRDFLLTALIAAGLVSFVTIPLAGHLSDRFGRKRIYLIGSVATGIFGFIYFAMLNTMVPAWMFLGIILSFVPHDLMYGPQAALIAECFTPRLRYSGASLGYQLASIIAGGPAPLVATALVVKFHSSLPVAIYIAIGAAIAFLATLGLKDNSHRDITVEYDDKVPAAEAKPAPAAS
jgi:MFS family permease